MKEIPIKNTNQFCLVDDDLYDELVEYGPWYLHHGYVVQHGRKQGDAIHRFIVPGAPNVDHKDFNRLNNQRSNLRAATTSQNRAHRRLFRNSRTGLIGVCLHARTGRYQSYVNKDGIRYNVGTYDCAILAAKARDKKAFELFGEFAVLNFPI